jgi:hypothetical protein
MNRFFGLTSLLILVASTFITLSGTWIAPDISRWQASLMGDGQYFPALTIFLLAIPPLLLLLLIKKGLMRGKK